MSLTSQNPLPPFCGQFRVFIKNSSGGKKCNVTEKYFERISMSELKNSHKLLNVSWRILCSKRSILRFTMPNENPNLATLLFRYLTYKVF